MKIFFDTLGCDKNTADNEYLAGLLKGKGIEIANRTGARDFDAVLITTCGFIESAKQQSLDTIHHWTTEKRRRNRPLAVFVAGCLSQQYGESIKQEIPDIDGITGVGDFINLADMIHQSLGEQQKGNKLEPFYVVNESPEASIPYDIPREPLYAAPYAYLKISDGCNHNCTFCAIPTMKGRHKSIPREAVLAEARRLVESGCRELNLVAQDCSDYGKDLYGRDYLLEDLIENLCAIEGDFWVRLFYLYPLGVTDRLLELWKNEPKLARYVDMPLQHLSPSVMRRMKRPHLEAKLDETISRLRTIPDFTLRTTFIVGFPGETDEDFQLLLDGMSEYQFDRLGVFTFSQEEKTPSYAMPGQIDDVEKRRRRQLVMHRQAEISAEKSAERLGRTERVLIENYDADRKIWLGRTEGDAPEIDGIVTIKAGRNTLSEGQFVNAKIIAANIYDVEAELA
jgi:ribosomal protein S12 methylthiotransferase